MAYSARPPCAVELWVAMPCGAMFWPPLMGEQKLSADAVHSFEGDSLADLGPVTHVRLNIHPDGGVSRFRVFGRRRA